MDFYYEYYYIYYYCCYYCCHYPWRQLEMSSKCVALHKANEGEKTSPSAVSFVNPVCHAPDAECTLPTLFTLSLAFSPLDARTQGKHVRHIMHAFYIIFDRPTRLESRSPLALRPDPLQLALPAPSAVPSASSSCSALIPINPGRADGRQA